VHLNKAQVYNSLVQLVDALLNDVCAVGRSNHVPACVFMALMYIICWEGQTPGRPTINRPCRELATAGWKLRILSKARAPRQWPLAVHS